MKMKKTLSIILAGILLVGSSSFIFANETLKSTKKTQDQPAAASKLSSEATEIPNVAIEVLNQVIDKLDGKVSFNLKDEEFREELLELIEEFLDESDDKVIIDFKNEEFKEELLELIEEFEEELEEDEIDECDDEDDEDYEDKNQIILENLHLKLLKLQLVYEKVPAQAKPAIEKKIKKIQLKIDHYTAKIDGNSEKLIPKTNM